MHLFMIMEQIDQKENILTAEKALDQEGRGKSVGSITIQSSSM